MLSSKTVDSPAVTDWWASILHGLGKYGLGNVAICLRLVPPLYLFPSPPQPPEPIPSLQLRHTLATLLPDFIMLHRLHRSQDGTASRVLILFCGGTTNGWGEVLANLYAEDQVPKVTAITWVNVAALFDNKLSQFERMKTRGLARCFFASRGSHLCFIQSLPRNTTDQRSQPVLNVAM